MIDNIVTITNSVEGWPTDFHLVQVPFVPGQVITPGPDSWITWHWLPPPLLREIVSETWNSEGQWE